MLSHLHIENIAVIERTDIDFETGFCVLTGETGAGKSILIDSINAVLGERTSRELIRTGCERAVVSALFTSLSDEVIAALREMGIDPDEEGALLLHRTLQADGKSICRVNGAPVTAGMLREAAKLLVNIHGQHDNQALLSAQSHCGYLDRLGKLDEVLRNYQERYHSYLEVQTALKNLQLSEEEKARRLDLYTYQMDELEAADIKVGERDELTARRTMLVNAEKIALSLNDAVVALKGNEEVMGTQSLLDRAVRALQDCSRYMPECEQSASRILEMKYELDELADDLVRKRDDTEFNQNELDRIEDRLELLNRLSRKYGGDEEAMLQTLEQIKQELNAIQFQEQRERELKAQETQLYAALEDAAQTLRECRRNVADQLSERVCQELAFLNMPGVQFSVSQKPCDFTENGADEIEFLLSANPGEAPRPLAKIASGGELSRIMLSIKSVIADADQVDTLIFDEIDTGISGSAAQKVGLKLKQTAKGRQIICVTHLAQIAAQGDAHYIIEKHLRDGRTYTQVTKLGMEGRKAEIARIIGGETLTEATLKSAEEMLLQKE